MGEEEPMIRKYFTDWSRRSTIRETYCHASDETNQSVIDIRWWRWSKWGTDRRRDAVAFRRKCTDLRQCQWLRFLRSLAKILKLRNDVLYCTCRKAAQLSGTSWKPHGDSPYTFSGFNGRVPTFVVWCTGKSRCDKRSGSGSALQSETEGQKWKTLRYSSDHKLKDHTHQIRQSVCSRFWGWYLRTDCSQSLEKASASWYPENMNLNFVLGK